jgi:hypothetical protein
MAGTLVVHLRWHPDPSDDPTVAPTVVLQDDPITGAKSAEGDWSFTFEEKRAPLTTLTIDVSGDLPESYEYEPLQVKAPFFEKTYETFLTPTAVDITPATVRRLVNTPSRDQLGDGSFRLYQESRAVAMKRMERSPAGGGRISVWDVRAVYKFLEVAYVMAEIGVFMSSDEIEAAYNWLSQVVAGDPDIVAEALGSEGVIKAQRRLDEVMRIESLPFGLVWNAISRMSCDEGKVHMMDAFAESLSEIPRQRRDRIQKAIGVDQLRIANESNHCTGEIVRSDKVDAEQKRAILEARIEASKELEKQKAAEKVRSVRIDRLRQDLQYLKAARRVY